MFFSVLCLLFLCTRLIICALWVPAVKGLASWLSFVVSKCEFVTFPLVCVVLDCIDSCSLHPYLLLLSLLSFFCILKISHKHAFFSYRKYQLMIYTTVLTCILLVGPGSVPTTTSFLFYHFNYSNKDVRQVNWFLM